MLNNVLIYLPRSLDLRHTTPILWHFATSCIVRLYLDVIWRQHLHTLSNNEKIYNCMISLFVNFFFFIIYLDHSYFQCVRIFLFVLHFCQPHFDKFLRSLCSFKLVSERHFCNAQFIFIIIIYTVIMYIKKD